MKVALATCTKLPAPDTDQALLVGALEDAGAKVRLLSWDDPTTTPDAGELVVIRSTWNYFEDVDGFLAWVERPRGRPASSIPPPSSSATRGRRISATSSGAASTSSRPSTR